MSHGSLYSDLDDARPIGRAWLLNLYGHCYPGLDLGRWYPVLPGGGPPTGRVVPPPSVSLFHGPTHHPLARLQLYRGTHLRRGIPRLTLN